MKRTTLLSFMLAICCIAYAQNTNRHSVKRGETLESIATKYGVTVEELKNANKEAQMYFYPGMNLVIPQHTNTTSASSPKGNNNMYSNSQKWAVSRMSDIKSSVLSYVEIGYNKMHFSIDEGLARDFNCFNLGYHVIFDVFQKVPELKAETGLNFLYGTSNNVQYNVLNKPLHVDYKYSAIRVPLLLSYQLFDNGTMQISPNIGAYVKYNISASSKDYSDDKDVQAAYQYYGMTFGTTNLFSQKQSKMNWNRFGIGMQLGVNAIFQDCYIVGINYSTEFNEIDSFNGYKISKDLGIKLGYVF